MANAVEQLMKKSAIGALNSALTANIRILGVKVVTAMVFRLLVGGAQRRRCPHRRRRRRHHMVPYIYA